MPDYKRQHYLPVSYLKNFAIDQANPSRTSQVWRIDGDSMRPVCVEYQCREDYFYSKKEPEKTEKMFGEGELFYSKCVEKIKMGEKATFQEYFGLILLMFDLHIRNAFYANWTGQEGIEAYRMRTRTFIREFLLHRKEGDATEDEAASVLKEYWRVAIFPTEQKAGWLLTSDNPSLWLSLNRNQPRLDLVALPITPFDVAIAFDRRSVRLNGSPLTPSDSETLNMLQITSAMNCVYSFVRFSDDNYANFKSLFARKPQPNCGIDATDWKASLLWLMPNRRFSFIESPLIL